jgi:hypothetical protein
MEQLIDDLKYATFLYKTLLGLSDESVWVLTLDGFILCPLKDLIHDFAEEKRLTLKQAYLTLSNLETHSTLGSYAVTPLRPILVD